MEELFDNRVKGARRQRTRMTLAGILLFAVLLTGGVFAVRRMRQAEPASQSTTKPAESVTEQVEEPETEAAVPAEETPTETDAQPTQETPADAQNIGETPTDADAQSTGETPTDADDQSTAETPTEAGAQPSEEMAAAPTEENTEQPEETSTDAPTEPPTQAEPTEDEDEVESVNHRLTIYWQDDEAFDKRPRNVYIKVYHQGEEVAFLELNDKKNWTVTWQDTYPVRQLDLKSNLPEGMDAVVRVDGNDFTVTVSAKDENTAAGMSNTPEEGGEKLPQTGADWHTPGKLALTGIGFLAVGLTMKRRELM